MTRIPNPVRRHLAAVRAMALFTAVCGIVYPLVVTGVAQATMPDRANGSPVKVAGQTVGSKLVCQAFVDDKGNPLVRYFQPRPSGASDSSNASDPGCNTGFSAGSNLSPTSQKLKDTVNGRIAAVAAFENVDPSKVPQDAVTESASGLDPDISPEYAAIQVARVAKARNVDPAVVTALVEKYTTGRPLGILGAPRVNVLELNVALDSGHPVTK
jgi:K+-transporting ATPase ATPase C chain